MTQEEKAEESTETEVQINENLEEQTDIVKTDASEQENNDVPINENIEEQQDDAKADTHSDVEFKEAQSMKNTEEIKKDIVQKDVTNDEKEQKSKSEKQADAVKSRKSGKRGAISEAPTRKTRGSGVNSLAAVAKEYAPELALRSTPLDAKLARDYPSLIVYGAGLREANGEYLVVPNAPDGFCGAPEWRQVDGPYKLFWGGDQEGSWIIGHSYGTEDGYRYIYRSPELVALSEEFDGEGEEFEAALKCPPVEWGGPPRQGWEVWETGYELRQCTPGSGKCIGGVEPSPVLMPNTRLSLDTPSLLVSGAGLSEANGEYRLAKELHCGLPEWRMVNGHFILFWAGDTEGGWVLGHSYLLKDGYRYRNVPNELVMLQRSSDEEDRVKYLDALQNPPVKFWGGPQENHWKTFLTGFTEEECGPGSGKCFGGVDPPPSFIPNYVATRRTEELIVTSAGLAEVNGTYFLNKRGKHCGMPEWHQDGGPWLLFWAGDQGGGWIIGNSHVGPDCWYYIARPSILEELYHVVEYDEEYHALLKTPPEDLVDGPPERGWVTFVPEPANEDVPEGVEPEEEPSSIKPLQCWGGIEPPPIIIPIHPPPPPPPQKEAPKKKAEPKKKQGSQARKTVAEKPTAAQKDYTRKTVA
eukprot:gnl/MRDRNA2_/MRDRNA2_106251_c0_seq1.p1 gnl/MRDRNA2_/MRDRNA2_106251_c0~~gnl/MRDRNA2_/MRDRNA2_106251_c0_seq1.p1  ORF type:complete len:662 (+),score=159.22 gnl/MRDRNA2_/MRDRNA2_106251_c0_seq1:67-1986(+)